jgi:glycosyltransferase involved in cell wall biosynthesis
VSRFDIYKHHRAVVQGFAALPAKLRNTHKLVFLGETDMPETEPVRALIATLDVSNSVQIMGAVPYESLPGWYAHSDMILFASSCENCPNILLEALGSGCPVLSSNVLPMPEFGGPGLSYFSPFEPQSITEALRDVMESPAKASAIARAAVEQSRRYDWAATAAQTWAAILALPDAKSV